ncbi:hypothetical protein ACFW9M_04815 [Streptomyces lydicus]|uniref:hypothetical protein n=1 Tax=Streptomyces lydicus TaxID=47763 RepID=UPI00367DA4EE
MDTSDYKVADRTARLYRLAGSEYAQFEHYGDYFAVTCSTAKQVGSAIEILDKLPIQDSDYSKFESLLLAYGSREPQYLSFSDVQQRATQNPEDILFVRLRVANDLVVTWRRRQFNDSGKIFPAQAGLISGPFYEHLVAKFLEELSTLYVSQSASKIATDMAVLHKEAPHK